MTKNNLIVLLLIILFTGAGFFAGTKYQQGKKISLNKQFDRGMMRNGQAAPGQGQRNRTNFRPIAGDIASIDDKSITVKSIDGSSKIILFTDKTILNIANTALFTDLKVGKKVSVFGTENADGSVTAQNIQLNPISREPNTTPTPVSPFQGEN